MRTHFTTPKGTELPILNLRGKEYLEVKYRIVWFREEHPLWGIETELLANDNAGCIARATIKDEIGRIVATSHKSETKNDFPDFLEKSETSAIGRALALIGFGTQFCADELDEGERIVDSPTASKGKPNLQAVSDPTDPGSYVIKIGKKFIGMPLDKVGPHDASSYAKWLRESAEQKKEALSGVGLETVLAIDAFVKSRETQRPAK